jgi:cellulose synthase (UDP-forming)
VTPVLFAATPMLVIAGMALLVLPILDPDHPWSRRIGAGLTALLLIRYLVWRVTVTLPPFGFGAEPLVAYGYMLVEALSSLAGLLLLHVLSRTRNRSREADAHPVDGFPDGPPLIDIFIPTYNEKREIVERTITGALAQDYPCFRVWVLDDGRRPWLQVVAQGLGAGYLTRGDNEHGKAGNMNAGFAQVLALSDPPDVIAVLDADFVPTPRFLSRAAALLHDPNVAVVQTPQRFFNPDPIQLNLGGARIVPDEQRFFFDIILASKDAHGTAFSCGTSGLVRVDQLVEIGGFPTESVTEDLLLSLKMKALGYQTVYLNEPLSVGLAPEGLREYLTQRGRWCLGTMQIVRTAWGPFSPGRVPWLMRLHTLDTVLFWIVGSLMRLCGIIVPILYWWIGLVVMTTDLPSIIFYLGPYWVCCVIFLGWISRGTNVPVLAEAMALLMAVDALRASAVGLFGARNQQFKVTAKGASRDRVVIHWVLMRRFLLLGGLTFGGLVLRLWTGPIENTPPEVEMLNLFWSFYNIATLALAGMICIELPRFRSEERFGATETVTLLVGEVSLQASMRDISLSGASLCVNHAALAGATSVRIGISDVGEVSASIVTRLAETIQVRFDLTHPQRAGLIRKIFSGRYISPITSMPSWSMMRLLFTRLVG